MATIVKDAQELIDGLENVLLNFANAWRTRNWLRVLITLFAALTLVGNPLALTKLLSWTGHPGLPGHYTAAWLTGSCLLLLSALFVALRSPPPPIPPAPTASAVKGLRPFGYADSEIFTHLQREDNLRELVAAISDRDFRFGILCGESGCGKSSLLQAGLWPRLAGPVGSQRCVYVKFTDLDPTDSVREAVVEQLNLPRESIAEADLFSILHIATKLDSTPLVMLFDQFEQFFAHYGQEVQYHPFVRGLNEWYRKRPPLPIRILLCLRGDFLDRMIDLQKVMGYSLGPQESFRLKKFRPDEAVAVFQAIAEQANLSFDRNFLREMAEEELANREDGLVSPVDIQIFAWMVVGQGAEDRAFDRQSYRRLGGVDGLLERFLMRTLEARETEARRQAAVNVLLALTDMERSTRSGTLTLADLRRNLTGTVAERDIEESAKWLSRSDVRLITDTTLIGVTYYELAHERLIPALRKVADQVVGDAARANQLLDRRMNEWLANDRSKRFLLSWSEWRLIECQRPYIVWEPQASQKATLLSKTKERWRNRFGLLFVAIVALIGVGIWWNSPFGQIWQIKQEVARIEADRRSDGSTQKAVVDAWIEGGIFNQALRAAEGLSGPDKVYAQRHIAQAYAKLGDSKSATAHLQEALKIVWGLPDYDRTSALLDTVQDYVKLGDTKLAVDSLQEALKIAHGHSGFDKASILPFLGQDYAKLGDRSDLLEAVKIANGLGEYDRTSILQDVAHAYAKLGDRSDLQEAVKIAWSLPEYDRTSILQDVAHAYSKLGGGSDLQEALEVPRSFFGRDRDDALLNVVEACVTLGDRSDLQEALKSANGLSGEDRCFALGDIAQAYAALRDRMLAIRYLQEASEIAEGLAGSDKADALCDIAQAYAALRDRMLAIRYLQEASEIAEGLAGRNKADVLGYIARTYVKLGDRSDLQEAVKIARGLGGYDGGTALLDVVKAYTKTGDGADIQEALKIAHGLTGMEEYDALEAVGRAYATLGDRSDFQEAVKIAQGLKDYDRPTALQDVFRAYLTSSDGNLAFRHAREAMKIAQGLQDYDAAVTMIDIVQVFARLGKWKLAWQTAASEIPEEHRVQALGRILKVWVHRSQPNAVAIGDDDSNQVD